MKTIPLSSLIEVLSIWLDAKATADVELTLAFKFTDLQENYGLQIRRGVAEFWDTLPDHYDFAVVFDVIARMSGLRPSVKLPR